MAQQSASARLVGFLVNPVAGMGGSVGLKGTDGDAHARALALGAKPVAPDRASIFLAHLRCLQDVDFLSAPGAMGADLLEVAGARAGVVGEIGDRTTSGDTRRVARAMVARGVGLLAVVGGDGTLRDVCSAIDMQVPVVAVPAGVKVYSAAFAVNGRAAASLVDRYVAGADVVEAEVLDIDEDAYRDGRLEARHYGYVLVPDLADLVQGGKESSGAAGQGARADAAEAVVEAMEPGRLYLLGPGTTVRAVADALGCPKTLLGIDAVRDGRLVGRDLNERGILKLLAETPDAAIVVTPLGGNGFGLGRGNRQLTPAVLRAVGVEHLIVIAARDKAMALDRLRVDTGDSDLDASLAGYREVLTAPGHSRLMRIA